jgi:hypothetical protein
MDDRQMKLLALIEKATGKSAYSGTVPEERDELEEYEEEQSSAA